MNANTSGESRALAERTIDATPMASPGNTALILNPDHLKAMMSVAEIMATGLSTVPQHLQKKPGDCLAVVMQATQWGMNPFAVAQKTHVVNGTLGYEAQLVNAVLESSGAIDSRFSYEYRGDGATVECRVGAIPHGEAAIQWGEWLSAANVTTKNSPLWKTNPKQQLGYLQVKNWARAFKPGAILGVYTADELMAQPEKFMGPADVVSAPPPPAAPTHYPADQFEKNLPAWLEVISKGRKTADQIITMAETKHPLTEDQKKAIRAGKTAGATDAPVKVTYAQVADKLNAATNLDALAEAADLIGAVESPEQRTELVTLHDNRRAELA